MNGDYDLELVDVVVQYTFIVSVEPDYTRADVAEAVRGYIASVGYALDEPTSLVEIGHDD